MASKMYFDRGCTLRTSALTRRPLASCSINSVLSLKSSSVVTQAPNHPMGCCGSTAAVSPVHRQTPPSSQRTVPNPVPPQTSVEMSPIPPSRQQSRPRTRTQSEPTHHSRMSSQDLDPRDSVKSPSQLPQSSKPSSSQSNRTRAKSLVPHKKINRSPMSRIIKASIECVVCLPTLISFIWLVLRNGRQRECIDRSDKPILTSCFPLGYWRNLWSNLDFADKPLKDCVNLIHDDIVKIWDPNGRNKVGCFSCPCFNCSTESVYLKHAIHDKHIPHRQRSSCNGWRRIAEVSEFTICRDVRQIELSIAMTGADLETSSQTGFTMYIKGRGEWTVDTQKHRQPA